ncbi:MAG: hypothetical protein PHP98_02980 [Kiritimatiellae bacterium]|nr:hypothetical protein [Kiritimatiellia bacterium]
MKELSKTWMESDPKEAGYLYMDGHVRVYHGKDAVFPRRYVSRERLCLRGTTDYWVNDAIGRPFLTVYFPYRAKNILHDLFQQIFMRLPAVFDPDTRESP